MSANDFRYEPGEKVTWQGSSGRYKTGTVIKHVGQWVTIQTHWGTWVEHEDHIMLELPA